MARTPGGPWWNKWANQYSVVIDGGRENLGKDRKEAVRKYHRLMADREKKREETTEIDDLVDMYLRHKKDKITKDTLEVYVRHLKWFCKYMGKAKASDVTVAAVLDWSKARRWNPTTRCNAIGTVIGLFRWAKQNRHLDTNPIEGIKKPTPLEREKGLADADFRKIWEASDEPFRDFLTAMRETGARPSEIMQVEARHLSVVEHLARFASKTTGSTGRLREIILTDKAMALFRRMAEANPSGPMFRNSYGKPWNRRSIAKRFWRARVKHELGREVVCEGIRHTYITDGLEKGAQLASVSTLVGHRDGKMVMRVYSKLRDRKEHLREVANLIRPDDREGHADREGRDEGRDEPSR
jgi:integrase